MKKKILIVDDEADLVKVVKMRLKVSGYEPLTATSGAEGLEVAKKETPDLILLDVSMPEMDGYQTLEKIKADSQLADIPVIMFTAHSQADDIANAAQLGAVDYIVKPFNHLTLLEKVRTWLTR
ncbi:MAG: response regulator [PVC group bacterium]|nr:response regulator [PVC group bacterium]